MLRVSAEPVTAVLVAAVFVPALSMAGAVAAKEMKPKFGDIGGVYYTDVSENREACRQAIRNKIALCRQNTSFESNTMDRKYPGCLPIFRDQSRGCADHFRSEAYKCQGAGAVRIADFTGFACTVTATVVEEGEEPEQAPGIAPADRMMRARTRANVRGGPGTDHAKVGVLQAGEEVHVTGEAGGWLRIAAPGGGAAFVHRSLLVATGSGRTESPANESTPNGETIDITIAAAKREYEAAKSRSEEARTAYYKVKESLRPALKWTSLDLAKCITQAARSASSWADRRERQQQCRNRHKKLAMQKRSARSRLQSFSERWSKAQKEYFKVRKYYFSLLEKAGKRR